MSSSGVCAVSRRISCPESFAPRGVAALAVGLRLARHLHQERDLLGGEPGQDPRVEHGAEVVGVGEERVLVARRRASARACRRSAAPCRCRRAPAGTTRAPGSGGHSTGCRSSTRIFGSLFWRKSAGRSEAMLRVLLERGERVLAGGERVHQHERQARAVLASAARGSGATMMSRKVWPSLTSSSDFAFSIPMLVPRPPLSLITTVRSSASRSASSGSRLGLGDVLELLEVVVGQHPRLARHELLVVVLEGGDRRVGHALRLHLLLRGPQSVVAHHAPS